MPGYSLFTIPVFTIMGMVPHAYALSTVSKHIERSNANSRGLDYIQHLKKTLPAPVFATYERAKAAHKNSVESMPLLIAATLSGVFAEKLTNTDVGNAQFSTAFLGIRALYILLYINTSSERYSYLRSLTWIAGAILCFYQIYKAAVALA